MAPNKRIRPYHFNIEYFRNFKEVSFELGRKITVISGQNGCWKIQFVIVDSIWLRIE